jgi:hypothetical protein
MKNFEEKQIIDLNLINGGEGPINIKIGFTMDPTGFMDGIKWNFKLNLDKLEDK